ncbi:MAG: hypothetical protein AAGG11_04735, partial [Pseudomonadota bacterium]
MSATATRETADERAERHAERRFNVLVQRNLTRNFLIHLFHGMFGQTGFRLLNAPTFLPAFVLLLSEGSDFAVGLALSIQSFGLALTPMVAANLIQHRHRVLPTGMVIGALMRASVLWIALSGLLLPASLALPSVYFGGISKRRARRRARRNLSWSPANSFSIGAGSRGA